MNSKEALEIIGDIPLGDNPYQHFQHDYLKKVYKLEYEAIKRDLEVLEILKKHLKVETDYCGDSEFKTHTTISLYWDNQKLSVDSKEGKEHKLVKEWLENGKTD